MTTNVCIAISSKTLRAMLDYQEEQEAEFDPASLAEIAIFEWLERQRERAKPQGQRGYFWKKLFLPDGTRLRVSNHRMTRYAAIVGDDLVHECMTMSPNRFVQSTLGSARNAWNVVYVQMPGTREWKMAFRLRCEQESEARRNASHLTLPVAAEAPAPRASAEPQPRCLPDGPLLAPKLRADAAERRLSYRRAEDLLLD
jgi:hypothetical protein